MSINKNKNNKNSFLILSYCHYSTNSLLEKTFNFFWKSKTAEASRAKKGNANPGFVSVPLW